MGAPLDLLFSGQTVAWVSPDLELFLHHCGWYLLQKGHYIGIDCVSLSSNFPIHLLTVSGE